METLVAPFSAGRRFSPAELLRTDTLHLVLLLLFAGAGVVAAAGAGAVLLGVITNFQSRGLHLYILVSQHSPSDTRMRRQSDRYIYSINVAHIRI